MMWLSLLSVLLFFTMPALFLWDLVHDSVGTVQPYFSAWVACLAVLALMHGWAFSS